MRYVRLAPAQAHGRAPAVFSDDRAGVADLAEHFWQAGHRRFGVVIGPSGHSATVERCDAFMTAIAHLGGNPEAVLTKQIAPAGSILEQGRAAAMPLLAAPDRPTAIFAFNDEIAAGVMVAARICGLSVPENVAVAGFDDSDVSRFTWPPLTTVRQPIQAMAKAAVGLMLDTGAASECRLPVELIVRGSTQR